MLYTLGCKAYFVVYFKERQAYYICCRLYQSNMAQCIKSLSRKHLDFMDIQNVKIVLTQLSNYDINNYIPQPGVYIYLPTVAENVPGSCFISLAARYAFLYTTVSICCV